MMVQFMNMCKTQNLDIPTTVDELHLVHIHALVSQYQTLTNALIHY